MSLLVRQIGLADVGQLSPLFDAYRVFYGQPSDPDRAREWLQQRLARGEALVLLALRDGVAAGFALLYPGWSSVATGPVFVLNDLYVDAASRRAGVGRTLLAAAADLARERGALRISLETSRDNLAAQSLYRRAGWREDSTQWFHLPLCGAIPETEA